MRKVDVDQKERVTRPARQRGRRNCDQRLAADISMIDYPHSGRKTPAPNVDGSASSIEEARLRQQAIGVKLRHLFDEVVNEPVPDEFLEILRRADQRKADEGQS